MSEPPALPVKRKPRFAADEYKPNNPVPSMPQYDKRRLRRTTKRYYGTTDLKMPELIDSDGEVSGPSTKEIIRREIEAQAAGEARASDDSETDTASEGPPSSNEFVVDVSAPGVEIVGTKKIMFCSGSTDNLSAGFYLAIYSDSMRYKSLVRYYDNYTD